MRAELEEFLSLRQHGQIHHVDPAWLAELYIVLAMSTSALHHQGDGLSNEEAVNVCQTFYDASRLCLEVANWSSVRFRFRP